MDQIRRILSNIQGMAKRLTSTQKLLIASLVVMMGMAMFLVSQYAGSPQLVDLIPGGSSEDQQKATAFLEERGIPYTVKTDGKVALTADRRYVALAQMAKAQALPSDKKLVWENLASQQNWLMPKSQLDQLSNIALCNELATVIRNFPGINEASVFVSAPEPKGIGQSFRKPVAQVTVFPAKGQPLDQTTVNALADLVAGSVAGLEMRDVAIIDGTNRRSYRAVSQEDFFASSYLEQAAKVEQRVQEKLSDGLRFIQDVIVSVNAIVDGARRESKTTSYMNKGEGTVSLPAEESATTSTARSATGTAEPGVGSNVGMALNQGGGSGQTTNDETTTSRFDNKVGERHVVQQDARGRPTKINVTVSVPREYVASIVRQKKGAAGGGGGGGGGGGDAGGGAGNAEPTDQEILAEWEGAAGVKAKIEEMVAPLVETDGAGGAGGTGGAGAAGGALVAGTVRAFLIPVATVGMGMPGGGAPSRSGAGGGLGGSGLGNLVDSGWVRPVALGGLALASVGMMVLMVRKAGKAGPMPTAEELVGVPPTLEPGSDVVGEADEGDTAMLGIEVDDNSLKTSKMLDEVGTLVKTNPQAAVRVFNRWLSTED